MTTLGIDTFIRANQSNFGTASDGQSWTNHGTITTSISSNEGQITATSGFPSVTLGTNTSAPINALIRIKQNTSVFDGVGLCFRWTDANNYYFVAAYNTGLLFAKYQNGGFSSIASGSFTLSTGTFYWIRAIMVGNHLQARIWQDGNTEPSTWTIDTTDTTFSSAGNFGISTNGFSDVVSVDHLTVTDNQSATSVVDDVISLFKLQSALLQKNIASLFSLQSGQIQKDIITFFRVQSGQVQKNISSLFALQSGQLQKNISSLFALQSILQQKNITSLFGLFSQAQKNILSLFSLAASTTKNITALFSLQSGVLLHDAQVLFKLASSQLQKNTTLLFRISANQTEHIALFFRIQSAIIEKDIASFFSLSLGTQKKDIVHLFSLSATQTKNISCLFSLTQPIQTSEYVLFVISSSGVFSITSCPGIFEVEST